MKEFAITSETKDGGNRYLSTLALCPHAICLISSHVLSFPTVNITRAGIGILGGTLSLGGEGG